MIIALTGHRPNKLGNEYDGVGKYSDAIRTYLHWIIATYQPERIITGMALGADMIWAEIAIEYGIQFTAAIPCLNQESKWPQKSQDRYNRILANPLCEKKYVSDKPYDYKCMQARNVWMVDHSEMLVAIHDGTAGGTNNCIQYAVDKKNYLIVKFNPSEI